MFLKVYTHHRANFEEDLREAPKFVQYFIKKLGKNIFEWKSGKNYDKGFYVFYFSFFPPFIK